MSGCRYSGGHSPFGIEGWRFAFLTVALVSIAIGIGNFMFGHDPRFNQGSDEARPTSALYLNMSG